MHIADSRMAQHPEGPSAPASPGRRCRWSEVAASLAFSAATFEMFVLYGIVHWQIMFRWKPHLLRLIFAVLALVWAFWSFRGAPRWAAWIALGLALVALFTNAIIT